MDSTYERFDFCKVDRPTANGAFMRVSDHERLVSALRTENARLRGCVLAGRLVAETDASESSRYALRRALGAPWCDKCGARLDEDGMCCDPENCSEWKDKLDAALAALRDGGKGEG